jgi:hypothetical protein
MVGTTTRSLARLGSLLVAAGLVAAACGGSDSKYISNTQENLFFKVPKSWKQYKIAGTDGEGRVAELPSGFDRIWQYAFDADPARNPAVSIQDAAKPVARAEVWALGTAESDRMSLSRTREIAFNIGIDPLLYDPGAPPKWAVVDMNGKANIRLEFPKGVTGTRMAINVPNKDDPTKFHTIDAATLVDPLQKRVYLLIQTCSSQCYLDNRKVIDSVAESWTVNRS